MGTVQRQAFESRYRPPANVSWDDIKGCYVSSTNDPEHEAAAKQQSERFAVWCDAQAALRGELTPMSASDAQPIGYLYSSELKMLEETGMARLYQHQQNFILTPRQQEIPVYSAVPATSDPQTYTTTADDAHQVFRRMYRLIPPEHDNIGAPVLERYIRERADPPRPRIPNEVRQQVQMLKDTLNTGRLPCEARDTLNELSSLVNGA